MVVFYSRNSSNNLLNGDLGEFDKGNYIKNFLGLISVYIVLLFICFL